MSYLSTTINACPNIQAELSELFAVQNFGLFNEPLPLLEFLTSPENSRGLTLAQRVAPGGGKKRIIEARYFQRIPESDVTANGSNPSCTATDEVGDMLKEYTLDITENQQVAKLVTITDLAPSCRENGEYFNSLYLQMIDALERKLATKHTEDLAALNGKWASNVSVTNDQLVVKTYKDGTIDPYPYTMQQIDTALRKSMFDNAVVFSGSLLHDYYNAVRTGCCATNGINLMEQLGQYGKAVVYDKRFETTYGTDRALAVKPGALALLYWTFSGWSEGVAPVFVPSNSGFKATVFGMRTGIPMDLSVSETCAGTISIVVTATTKLVGLPDDMFADGDSFDGLNFVNEIKVTNV